MIHGPCGTLNPKSPCMIDEVCSKKFPKQFNEYSKENSDGYLEYRRMDNNVIHSIKIYHKNDKNKTENVTNIQVDNRWIVPHDLYLSTKYNFHINVEICSSLNNFNT